MTAKNNLIEGIIIEVTSRNFFIDREDRTRVVYKITSESGGRSFETGVVQQYQHGCPDPKKHQILYKYNKNEGYLWTNEEKIPPLKMILVDDCMMCPMIGGCKEIKNLSPKARFAMSTSPAYKGILKTCPLPDYKE